MNFELNLAMNAQISVTAEKKKKKPIFLQKFHNLRLFWRKNTAIALYSRSTSK